MDPFIFYGLGVLFLLILVPAIPVALLLRARDRRMEREEKTPEQVQAATQLAGMFYSVGERCIPGTLLIVAGAAFVAHFYTEHDGNWWWGIVMIVAGWLTIRTLAGKQWHRYMELRRFVNRGPYEQD